MGVPQPFTYITARLTWAGAYPRSAARSNHFRASCSLYSGPITSMEAIPSWFCSKACPRKAICCTSFELQTICLLLMPCERTARLHCSGEDFWAESCRTQTSNRTMNARTANLFFRLMRPPFRAGIETGENVRSNLGFGNRYLNAPAVLSTGRGGHQVSAWCERAYRNDNEPAATR